MDTFRKCPVCEMVIEDGELICGVCGFELKNDRKKEVIDIKKRMWRHQKKRLNMIYNIQSKIDELEEKVKEIKINKGTDKNYEDKCLRLLDNNNTLNVDNTAAAVARVIVDKGFEEIAGGSDPTGLCRGIEKSTNMLMAKLDTEAKDINNRETLISTAVSLIDDREIAELIADAVNEVGTDGIITVEEAESGDTSLDIVEGMRIDRGSHTAGFASMFGGDNNMKTVLEEPYIMVIDQSVEEIEKLLPLFEMAIRNNRPVLLVADRYTESAILKLIDANIFEEIIHKKTDKYHWDYDIDDSIVFGDYFAGEIFGSFTCVPITGPDFGSRKKDRLRDIAVLTGGRVITELENADFSMLGRAHRVIAKGYNTTIVGGSGDNGAIRDRIIQIRREIDSTESDYERDRLEKRLACLAGRAAILKLPGSPREKRLVEKAVCIIQSAIETGFVAGGASIFIDLLSYLEESGRGDDETVVEIIKQALAEPLCQIAEDSGFKGDEVAGFDPLSGDNRDMFETEIIDSVKNIKTILQKAVYTALMLIVAGSLIEERMENLEKDNLSRKDLVELIKKGDTGRYKNVIKQILKYDRL